VPAVLSSCHRGAITQINTNTNPCRSANALLEIPQRSGVLQAGHVVTALLIEDLQGMPDAGVEAGSSQT